MTEDYAHYLSHERALSSTTISYHREFVQLFLLDRFGTASVDLQTLDATDVLGFVRQQVANKSRRKRAKLMITSLRSFFRYLRQKGKIDIDLASAVPSVAQWSKASLPRAISSTQVELLISSRRGTAAIDRRDCAIFLLLARLGLRACEVVALTLDDIDWHEGCIAVRDKGGTWTKCLCLWM